MGKAGKAWAESGAAGDAVSTVSTESWMIGFYFLSPPHAVWGSSLGSGAAHGWGESFRFCEIFVEAPSQLYSLKCVSMVILHPVKLTVKINYHALQEKQRVAFEGLHPFVLLFQNITDFLKCQFFLNF